MGRSIKEIVAQCDELHYAVVTKPDKRNRRTWTIDVIDDSSVFAGLSDYLYNYDYRSVTLRRNNDFFHSYKVYVDNKGSYEYFVDCRKSLHRASPRKYINSLMKYSVYSNDISETKNVSSFRVTDVEMKKKKIDNYLDLCHYYSDYSAIGTGLTRNVRNIVLMDIDVNCEKEDNKQALDELLLRFGKHNALPDFIIFNHESKHMQLQWLVQSFDYKILNTKVYEGLIKQLENDPHKNKEIKIIGTDFLTLSPIGVFYRMFTRAMTELVKKHKFGDKNFTFWKAKNIYTALYRKQNLELKMPYLSGGEIKYQTQERMIELLETKEARRQYYEEALTFEELDERTKDFIRPIANRINKKKIEKIKDDDSKDVSEDFDPKQMSFEFDDFKSYGKSRNTFVFTCSREQTWETAREMNYRKPKDISNLDENEFNTFRNIVYSKVKRLYKEEDDKYHGCWPDTSNHSSFTAEEFYNTFCSSFKFAINNLNTSVYTEKQRQSSVDSRHLMKDLHIVVIDYLRTKNDFTRNDLLTTANELLTQSGQEKISYATLKRCITISNKLTEEGRVNLYKEFITGVQEREKQLDIAKSKNSKRILDTYTKRLDYLNINIFDALRKTAQM